jgi:hypothetical protein
MASDSVINVGLDTVLPEFSRLINQLMTDCSPPVRVNTGLTLTCGVPAGQSGARPPVGRDLACHLLTPAFAARKLHQNRVGRMGSGLEQPTAGGGVRYRSREACGDQLGTGLASPGVSGRTGSDPAVPVARRPAAVKRRPRGRLRLKGGS